MNKIEIWDALPAVFAGRDPQPSQVWQCACTFEHGKHYLITAQSGTGKSSLCAYLYGYRRDYSGTIAFDGHDVSQLTVDQWCEIRRTQLAYLPQEMRLFAELSALENVMLKNQLTNFKTVAEIEQMFEELGIADKLNSPAGRLSIGQQQRVAIIRTLCQPAAFYLLDEPVSHLDDENNAIAARLIQHEAQRQGAAVVVTSVGNNLALSYDHKLNL